MLRSASMRLCALHRARARRAGWHCPASGAADSDQAEQDWRRAQAGSLDFLAGQGFDFNKFVYEVRPSCGSRHADWSGHAGLRH